MSLICDTLLIKNLRKRRAFVLFVSLFFVVLVAQVVLREQVWVLAQCGSDLLLLFVASRVGDLDVAAFCGSFIDNLLQPDIELAVQMFWRGITAGMFFVSHVTAVLSRDLVQNLRVRLLLA